MKKVLQSCLLLILSVVCALAPVKAQETITIGDGTNTSFYVPYNSLYNYSFTEFIYTADEIGIGGEISSIAFDNTSTGENCQFDIYMKHVTRSSFTNNTDFESVTDSDLVFSGSFSVTSDWNTIDLDVPFTYDGSSNLMIAVHEKTSTGSMQFFHYTNAASRTIQAYDDTHNPTPVGFDPTTYSGSTIKRDNLPNIQISIASGPISCAKPRGLNASNISTNSAVLSWNNGDTETSWEIEVNDNRQVVTSNPYTLTGLTASTPYFVRVRAICGAGDTSNWSTMASFLTECGVVTVTDSTPYFDGFEMGEFGCWTVEADTNISTWNVTTGISYYTPECFEGTHVAGFFGLAYGYQAKLISPVLDLTAVSNPKLSFYHVQKGLLLDINTLQVLYRTDEDAEWTSLMSYTQSIDNWTRDEINLPNPTATYQIAFEATCKYGDPAQVDSFFVFNGGSCLTPTDIAVANVTDNSAEISWTAQGEETSWEIDVNGETVTATSNPYTLTNLTSGVEYIIRVRSVCSATETSSWSAATTFTTTCPTIVVSEHNPYHEGFEDESIDCWENEVIAGDYYWYTSDYDDIYEGEHYAYFTYQSDEIGRFITPVFDMSGAESATFTFAHKQEAFFGNQDVLEVYYRTSATDEWHELAIYDSEIPTYQVDTFELQGLSATYQLSFVGYGHEGYGLFLDDINITVVDAPCATPANVAVENNVVTWESEAANFNVMVVANGDTATTTVAGTTYTVEGLENGTDVVVLVQAICGGDNTSDWTEGLTFTFETTGINNHSLNATVYPNPTTNIINVECAAINADVSVYDMFGKLMMTSKITDERTELDFSTLAPGIYIVRIADEKATTNVKVVKE